MTKGSKNAKHEIFIKAMVPVNTVAGMISAYKKAYPLCQKDETARVGAYRLLQNDTIVQAIDKLKIEREDLIKKAQKEAIETIAREQILSQTQIESVLSLIASGKFRRKRVIAAVDVKSKTVVTGEIEEAPTETDMIAASDKLLKIKGAYAPLAVHHDAGDQFIEMLKQLSARKKPKTKNVQ